MTKTKATTKTAKKAKAAPPKEQVQILYTIEEVVGVDGVRRLRRTNHGIDSHRLYGMLVFATNDVGRQIDGTMPPPQRIFKKG